MEGDQHQGSIIEDSEPLVINSVEPDSTKLTFRQNLALFSVNLTILCYFIPLYAYFVALEQDVNNRIASRYNISDRNREACLKGNITNETAIHNHIEVEASHWMMLINGVGLIPAFFVSLLVGPISDKIGRKVAFLIPSSGALVKYIGCLLISYFQWPIWAYSIASFVEGFTGGSILFYAGCVSYTADNTNLAQRSFWVVMVDLGLSLSAVIANFASGYIITWLGYTWCYIIMGIVQILTCFIIVTLIRGTPTDLDNVKIFTLEHFKKSKNLFTKDNGTNRRWKLNMLLVIISLSVLGNVRISDVLTYTMLNRPLCFSSIMVGNFFSCLHVVMTAGGLLLIFLRRYGVKEIPLLYAAFSSLIGFEVLISLAQEEKAMFACKVIFLFDRFQKYRVNLHMNKFPSCFSHVVFGWISSRSSSCEFLDVTSGCT